ncbi:MAG: TolC family protein [Alphaproteobacteria bacterium]|nr:TolC family protein [Alphaproteobacteria bacterium]
MLRYCWPLLAILLSPTAYAQQALQLDDAIAEALEHSPAMNSAKARVKASAGERTQAGAYPNPELGIEAENIGGDAPYDGFQSAEMTYGVTQQIEMWGKRSARKDAAHFGYDVAALDAEAIRLDVIRDVSVAYADAVAAQEKERYADEQHRIAGEELKSVSRRVAEAASPLMQRSKAEITVATSKFAQEEAKQEALVARKQLAVLMGRPQLSEALATDAFFAVESPKTVEEELLKATPDWVRWEREKKRATSLLELEKANALPDPTVNLGVRQFRDTDDKAFVLGVSLPIPVFDSNRGNIERARAEVSRSESDQQLALLDRQKDFARLQGALGTAYLQAISLRDTIIPAAEQAFGQSRYGYGAGKFQYLEVLDAQRTLFDARHQYITALRNYHTHKAELERIAGLHHTPSEGDHHDE